MALISVIVPVYKVEAYIYRCVDSILEQTYQDFELILVDDGSPDCCGAICDEYAQKDSRVHVIHQTNGGLSAARNAGIDWAFANSDSQWLTFIDSDDWVHPEMLERLLANAVKFKVNVSICGYALTQGETNELKSAEFQNQTWEPETFFVNHNTNAVVAWGKLYQKECFAEVRYPVGKIHEDEFTTYKILFAEQSVAVTDMPMYFYYQNANGITKSDWTPRRLDVWEAFEAQIAYFDAYDNKKMVKNRLQNYLWNTIGHLEQIRQLEIPGRFAAYVKVIKKKRRSLLRWAWKLGYRDIVTEYYHSRADEILTLPYIWKAKLQEKFRRE